MTSLRFLVLPMGQNVGADWRPQLFHSTSREGYPGPTIPMAAKRCCHSRMNARMTDCQELTTLTATLAIVVLLIIQNLGMP